MGLFDKKFCDICGEKINMLTQQKLNDGYLCSDCKHKLGSFTDNWKSRSVDDVKKHLELREQNKTKYQQFSCSASAGGRNSTMQVDFNNRWFIFAVDNRDYKSGNPQVFDFSQLQDFWLEEEFRTLSDSDNDGIPDNRDNFDNSNQNPGFRNMMNNMNMQNMMNNSMVNVPLSAQPFIRRNNSGFSISGIREVSGVNACFRVNDPYITHVISIDIANVTSGNNMELMNAYEMGVQIMQLCQQIKQGGAQPMNGFAQQPMGGYGQPMQNGYQNMNNAYAQPQQGYAQPQQGYAQPQQGYAQPQQGYAQPQQGYAQPQQPMQQPVQNAAWFCPNCGTQNTSNFCSGCGTPKS